MRLIGKILLFLFLGTSAWAQYLVSVRAGLINYAEGLVYLDEKPFEFRADRLQELAKGQYLRTGPGKVEVQLGPAASLWMGECGSLEMLDPDITDIRLRIETGSVFIEIIEEYENNKINIQLGTAGIELKETGLYRLDCMPPKLYAFNGKAEIQDENTKKTVKQGKFADLGNNIEISEFDRDRNDPFYKWTNQRSHVIFGRIRYARIMEGLERQRESMRLQWELDNLVRQQRLEEERRKIEKQQQQ
jgi:hypothetical protein